MVDIETVKEELEILREYVALMEKIQEEFVAIDIDELRDEVALLREHIDLQEEIENA